MRPPHILLLLVPLQLSVSLNNVKGNFAERYKTQGGAALLSRYSPAAMAPSRMMRGSGPVVSTMVLATPPGVGPAASVRSASSAMRRSMSSELAGEGMPCVFALVTARGPTRRASSRTSGESGTRRATVPSL